MEGRKLATQGGMRDLFRMLEIFSVNSGGGCMNLSSVRIVPLKRVYSL